MIIKENRQDFLSYLEDTSNLRGQADILYVPESREEIQEIARKCFSKKIPLTCSGAHTGTTGGCVPMEGAVLSLEKLNKIIDIDAENKIVRVEAGISLQDLERELNKQGFTFRAQPTESLAFVGAAVSTCASGVRGLRYGAIRKYIKSLKIIFIDGFALDIPRGKIFSQKRNFTFHYQGKDFRFSLPGYNIPSVKTQAGYFVADDIDLADLFIGSEGTLGIIAEIELSVQTLAEEIFDGVIFFDHELGSLDFVDRVRELKNKGVLNPTSLEFFDANSLQFLRGEYPHIPCASSAVYFEQEVERKNTDNMMNKWIAIMELQGVSLDNVWFGDTKSEREKIYEFRHKLPQLINEFLRQHRQTKLATDIAVPHKNFRPMYNFYKKRAQEAGIDYVNFGHIGEDHLHFNFLPKNDKQHARAKQNILEFIKRGVSLGGTVSAEHGIGKIKKPCLEIMYGRRHVEEMAALKKYFDKDFILGRDNLFDKDILLGAE